jgi:TPR repeat protein
MKYILILISSILFSNIVVAQNNEKKTPEKAVINAIRPPKLNYSAVCQANDELNAANVAYLLKEEREGRFNPQKYLLLAKIYYYGLGNAAQNKEVAMQYANYAVGTPSVTAKAARRTLAMWRLKALKKGDVSQHKPLQDLVAEMQRDDLYESGYFAGQMAQLQGDYMQAANYYRSVLKKNPRANLALAALYFQEKLKAPNKTKVTELITAAQTLLLNQLNDGDCSALMPMASMFLNGEAMQKVPNVGAEWLQVALKSGYSSAGVRLGFYYHHGEMVDKSEEMARKWWQIAADVGSKRAMFLLARSLVRTKDDANIRQAIMLLNNAAELNYMQARDLLNRIYQGEYGEKYADPQKIIPNL